MKDFKKLKMLINVGKSMLDEAKKSEASKRAGIDIKADLKKVINAEMPKKLVKDIVLSHKAKIDSLKEMLNSDEAAFIKMAATGSEPGKKVAMATEKVANGVEILEDLIPEKIRIEYINYKHWCLNNYYMAKMGLSAPIPFISGMLRYTWIFDLAKANSMTTNYVQGRSGANLKQVQKHMTFMIKEMCDMLIYALQYPDEVVLKQNLVPPEIVRAMGLQCMLPELPALVLPRADQFSGVQYLDQAEAKGIGVDTCGLPRFTAGVALMDEVPLGKCIISSNLPCDGGLASYEAVQQSVGNVPIYRLSVPYDFRNDDSIDMFVEDLKGMIEFLEENTGHTMDWENLRHSCENYNNMVECELERWELAKTDNPPQTNDALWFAHYWNFIMTTGSDSTTKHHKELMELSKKAFKKGQPSFPNMKYRAIVWNPPPYGYGHMWNWLERCWGVGSVMDLETYGDMEYINTTSPESMLRGLGKRYMWATMAKHTRGAAENMLGDLQRAIEEFKPDFIIYPAHMGCKNSMSLESTMKEQCKKMGVPFCIFRYELLDSRVTSRHDIREQFNKFMTETMNAKPLDARLLQIDDSNESDW